MPRTDVKPSINAIHTKNREFEEAPEHLLLTEVPSPPENFSEEAIFWWNYYCGLLIECGNFSRLFINAVKNYCSLCGMIEVVEKQVQVDGIVVPVAKKYKGEEYYVDEINPMVKELRGMYRDADMLGTSLGLTLYASKINAVDATGTGGPQVSSPPESGFDEPTIPFTGTA